MVPCFVRRDDFVLWLMGEWVLIAEMGWDGCEVGA